MDYLEKTLFPTLTENDIIIMDNMRTHHATAVTELAERLNIHILYLPPYSPDMNPIEKMWSKIKSILRKTKARTTEDLQEAINNAFKKRQCKIKCVSKIERSSLHTLIFL